MSPTLIAEPAFVSFAVPTLAALAMLAFHVVTRLGADLAPRRIATTKPKRTIPSTGKNIPGAGQ